MELNTSQIAAIQTKEQMVLVVAGSGSGKTTCIMERVKFLLDGGVNPKDIVAITFTNLAAFEIKDRIGCKDEELFIGTIHSYANKKLLEVGVNTSKYLSDERFTALIDKAVDTTLKNPPKYLLVDEFQDLCDNEYEFIMNVKATNYFFVGDDWQAIYGFKGSNVKIFTSLARDPDYKVYLLPENYRSGREIIKFGEEQIADVKGKIYKKVDPKVSFRGNIHYSTHKEVISVIEKNKDYKDWFVLTRSNAESDAIKALMKKKNIPYVSFKKRDCSYEEIQDYLNKDLVKVLTIHAAKGLESKNVAVVGTNQWNDEEKRICYVAATRAKENLYWCPKISKREIDSLSSFSDWG